MLYILWLCRGKILINVYVHVIIKCVLNHVRFYNNFHSDQKKTKNEKKYYANAKVSFPWHTLNTPSHTSDLDTCVRTKLITKLPDHLLKSSATQKHTYKNVI